MGNSSNSNQFNVLCFGDSLTKGFYKDPENYVMDPNTNLPKYIFYAPYGDELKLLIGKELPSDIKYCTTLIHQNKCQNLIVFLFQSSFYMCFEVMSRMLLLTEKMVIVP